MGGAATGSGDGVGEGSDDDTVDDTGETALAPVYREALRLDAAGRDHEAIAAALGVQVEAVPSLLELARRKQARAAGS